MKSFFSAVRLLTILPAPASPAPPGPRLLYWFPPVGLLIGCLVVLADRVLFLICPDPIGVAPVLLVIFGVLLTRALHLDGVGDTADALGSPTPPARRLDIMRDPRMGAFGVSAIALVLIAKVSALSAMSPVERMIAIPLSAAVARAWAVASCAMFRYARPEGLGAAFIGRAGWTHVAVAFGLSSAVWVGWNAPYHPFFAAAVSALAVAVAANHSLRGITGDVLGAVVEISECASLLAFASLQ